MQVTVSQTQLKAVLTTIIKAVPSKPQLPILSSFLISADETGVTFSATDLYFGIRTRLVCEVTQPGTIAVPAKTLLEIVSSLGSGELSLKLEENTLIVSSRSSTSKIQIQPGEEYPAFPTPQGNQQVLPIETAQEIDTFVTFSTSIDQSRLVLTTLLFDVTADVPTIVGTDGFRLSILQQPDLKLSIDKPFLVPAKAFSEVVKIVTQQDAKELAFSLSDELKQVFFITEQTQFFVRIIDGDFPPYARIVPPSFSIQAHFTASEFSDVLKQALVFAKEASNIVVFSFSEKRMTISVAASAIGSFEGHLDLDSFTGEPSSIAFNAKYLQEFLNQVKPESIVFEMNDKLKPALWRPADKPTYSYIVMPFRMNE